MGLIRKFTLYLIIMTSLLSLSACALIDEEKVEEVQRNKDRLGYDDLSIAEDSETGCKYIIFQSVQEGGITPLLKSDGTPDCGI